MPAQERTDEDKMPVKKTTTTKPKPAPVVPAAAPEPTPAPATSRFSVPAKPAPAPRPDPTPEPEEVQAAQVSQEEPEDGTVSRQEQQDTPEHEEDQETSGDDAEPEDDGASVEELHEDAADLQALAQQLANEAKAENEARAQAKAQAKTVTVPRFNLEKNEWERVQVSEEEAEGIRVSSVVEAADRADGDALSTEGRDPLMQDYWGSSDPNHPSNLELMKKGYAPVRNWPNSPFQKKNVPGYGEVYTFGTLVLFECPRDIADRRRALGDISRRKDADDRLFGPMEEFKQYARSEGAQIIEDTYNRGYGPMPTNSDDPDYQDFAGVNSQLGEDDYATAAARQAADQLARQGRRTYGGFRGDMGPGVPESPINRNRRA